MKFLLVAMNAKYIHSNPAVYSLQAYVGERLRSCVEVAEYTINNRTEDILADLYLRKPDAVAFSCYIWNWNIIQRLFVELHKLLPHIPVWLGGPEVSFDAEEILERYPMLTGIMAGEGEETFRELLEYYAALGENDGGACERDCRGQDGSEACRERARLADIPGLVLRSGRTGERELMAMDALPFLYEDLQIFDNRILYYESGRGCPYKCSYCLSSVEKKLRLRGMDDVRRHLQFFLEHRVPQVKFVDRTFNCDHAHAMAVWQYILEHDNGVTNFHFEIAADLLREDEIALLGRMRPGLVQLEIGVQTANLRTLREIRRKTDLDRLERAVAQIRGGRNIHQHLDLIAGLPYEDYDSFRHSFDRVYAMKPHQLQLGFLKVLKGSYMHEKALDYGMAYQSEPPYEVLYTRWMSYEDMLRLKRVEEMVEVYFNSSQFTYTLPYLLQAFAGPFAMYEALADFYARQDAGQGGQARVRRYEMLLAFAGEQDGGRLELYRQLLTYDLYLRENPKSRPAFAPPLEAHRDKIRQFYMEEERSRALLPDYAPCDARQLSRMTHLEPFSCPVWEEPDAGRSAETQTLHNGADGREACEKTCRYVLFDYRQRDPLSGNVRTAVVDIPW